MVADCPSSNDVESDGSTAIVSSTESNILPPPEVFPDGKANDCPSHSKIPDEAFAKLLEDVAANDDRLEVRSNSSESSCWSSAYSEHWSDGAAEDSNAFTRTYPAPVNKEKNKETERGARLRCLLEDSQKQDGPESVVGTTGSLAMSDMYYEVSREETASLRKRIALIEANARDSAAIWEQAHMWQFEQYARLLERVVKCENDAKLSRDSNDVWEQTHTWQCEQYVQLVDRVARMEQRIVTTGFEKGLSKLSHFVDDTVREISTIFADWEKKFGEQARQVSIMSDRQDDIEEVLCKLKVTGQEFKEALLSYRQDHQEHSSRSADKDKGPVFRHTGTTSDTVERDFLMHAKHPLVKRFTFTDNSDDSNDDDDEMVGFQDVSFHKAGSSVVSSSSSTFRSQSVPVPPLNFGPISSKRYSVKS